MPATQTSRSLARELDRLGMLSDETPVEAAAVALACALESVGPFPQEPVFGSPEAVERAAETIRGLTPDRDQTPALLRQVERLTEQRDALADALLDFLNNAGTGEELVARAEDALRKAGR